MIGCLFRLNVSGSAKGYSIMANNEVLAIITARGGSKRLPKKNLRKLGGHSLLSRTIEASINAKSVNKTVLSTDCSEIAKEALKHGCDVPFIRPPELATDEASSEDVMLHAIDNLPIFEWVLLLQPTSPFRTSEDIDLAFKLVKRLNRNSCVGVTSLKSHTNPAEKYLFAGDVFIPHNQKVESFKRKQKGSFILNGAIYLIKTSLFLHTKKIVDADTAGIHMSEKKSLDIDTFKDLRLAAKFMEV